jgi:hypothetical protein
MAASIVIVWLGVSVVMSPATGQESQSVSLIKQYQEIVRDNFSAIGVVPLYNGGANYRVGDLWDVKMTRLLEGVDQCFSHLHTRSSPTTFPGLHYTTEASVGFWLRLKSFFDLASKTDFSTSVDVFFDNVVEETAAENDLVGAYRANSCPRAQLLLAQGEAKRGDDLPIMIGSLYRGKRRITILYGSDVDIKARADQIAALASGVPVEGGIAVAIGQGHSITVTDKDPVPLAFVPAFVPMRVSGANQGGQTNTEVKYEWLPFDPHSVKSQRAVLPALANAVASAWSWKSSPP